MRFIIRPRLTLSLTLSPQITNNLDRRSLSDEIEFYILLLRVDAYISYNLSTIIARMAMWDVVYGPDWVKS
jgi:hypothetical protein